MRRLNSVSVLITVVGVLLAALGVLLDLSEAVTLVGLLLVVAGVVKVVTVRLWQVILEPDRPEK